MQRGVQYFESLTEEMNQQKYRQTSSMRLVNLPDSQVEEAASPQPNSMRIEDVDIERREETQLWIDKYTSRGYLDLLTDEMTNRKVLTWLKSWDSIVYPDRAKVNLAPPDMKK